MKPKVNPIEPLRGLPRWTSQDTTTLTAAARAFDLAQDLSREAGSACKVGYDEGDPTEPAPCPKGLRVTRRECHDGYVDVHARMARDASCFGCVVGAGRRLAYATGHEPSPEAVTIAVAQATGGRK